MNAEYPIPVLNQDLIPLLQHKLDNKAKTMI